MTFLRALGTYGLAAALWVAIAGCAHGLRNQPLQAFSPSYGYRFATTDHATNSDELFVILAFSGGGTRAAAFSFGALEELAQTKVRVEGAERSLLDEVDLISSVSGGSFTAAYYGLYRERIFQEFPGKFLYRNITMALAARLLCPVNWCRLSSPYFDRIDMAAEFYDHHIFDQKTFGALQARNARPFIVLNATDMSGTTRFEFTQSFFDLLGSDLGGYPVARGVAASSAFPFLLSPLTLQNYPKPPPFREPAWVGDALSDRQIAPREFAFAAKVRSYLDTTNHPYIHLLDGGLSDNIGLRGPAFAMTSVQNLWSLKQLLNERIKHVLVVTVNAKTQDSDQLDRRRRAPGLVGVASVVSTGPMGNYSDETVQYLQDTFETWRQEVETSREIARLKGNTVPALRKMTFHHLEVSFADVPSLDERRYLNSLPTTYNLPREAIDRLRAAARRIIHDSEALADLQAALANP